MGVKMRQPGLVAQKGVSSQEPCRAAGRSSLDARPYSGALFANRLRLGYWSSLGSVGYAAAAARTQA
jgi:hypothetical protein